MEIEKEVPKPDNLCIIAIGMAGSGKTTFVSKFVELNSQKHPTHAINLDPAVKTIPYKPILDIRETHQYRKVMKEYQLGPNGAILTALNMFTAQPEKIINKMQQHLKQHPVNTFVIDIPGQIEAFTWSASSMILTKSISLLMPVVLVYVVDAQRCQNPNSYLSNLLFAQSIEVRINCPMIVCLNKADIVKNKNCETWIKDYDSFTDALKGQDNYLSTLSKSVVLYMSDFFEKFAVATVSSKTGQGFSLLDGLLTKAKIEFNIKSSEQNKKVIEKTEKEIARQVANLRIGGKEKEADFEIEEEKQ